MSERSYLFVPGDRPERFDKARESGAHVVILDLEDAVLTERKAFARTAVKAWLEQAGECSTPVYLRINAVQTPWADDDCALLELPALRGVMIPKAEDPSSLARITSCLRRDQVMLPLVETVAGWFALAQIANVAGVGRLAFGSVDFMLDAGIEGDGNQGELDAVRTQLVLARGRQGCRPPSTACRR